MSTEVIDCPFVHSLHLYSDILRAVGLHPDDEALTDYLCSPEDERETVRAFVEAARNRAEDVGRAPGHVSKLMEQLAESLCDKLSEEMPGSEEAGPGDLVEALESLPVSERAAAADKLLMNGHARFVRMPTITAREFRQELADEAVDELALVKLVPYLRRELARRGCELDNEQVCRFFTEADDLEVPRCAVRLVRNVEESEFEKGLIPIEDLIGERDADEWLEDVRQKLLFRSHSAMHKAIAEATSLKYDCIHKALSGSSKAKRIQAEIKYCLERWLSEAGKGRELDIDDDYRGVPVEWTCDLVPDLEPHYSSKEEIYRIISRKTGIKAGSVRRYFQSSGQLKYAPLQVYRLAKKMVARHAEGGRGRSYLDDDDTRRAAHRIAARARMALRRLRQKPRDPVLERDFLRLRRSLIATMKEQRQTANT